MVQTSSPLSVILTAAAILVLVPVILAVSVLGTKCVLNYAWLVRQRRKYGTRAYYYFHAIWGADCLEIKGVPYFTRAANRLLSDRTRTAPDSEMIIAASAFKRQFIVIHHRLARVFLQEKQQYFTKFQGYFLLPESVGRGLGFIDGVAWKRQRALVSRLFHFEALHDSFAAMHDNCQKVLDALVRENSVRDAKCVPQFDIVKYVRRVIGRQLVQMLCGATHIDATFASGEDFYTEIVEVFRSLMAQNYDPTHAARQLFFGTRYWQYDCLLTRDQVTTKRRLARLKEVMARVVEEQKAKVVRGAAPSSLIDVLVAHERECAAQNSDSNGSNNHNNHNNNNNNGSNADSRLDTEQLIQHCFSMLFAGIDSTSRVAKSLLECMTMRRDVEAQLLAELAPLGFLREYQDAQRARFTENCIKEMLRYESWGLGLVEREALRAVTVGEFEVCAGDRLTFIPHFTTENEKYYCQALCYIPQRWELDECKNIDPFMFLPFSGGPRNCIGQHLAVMLLKVIMAGFLKTFSLQNCYSGTPAPDDSPEEKDAQGGHKKRIRRDQAFTDYLNKVYPVHRPKLYIY